MHVQLYAHADKNAYEVQGGGRIKTLISSDSVSTATSIKTGASKKSPKFSNKYNRVQEMCREVLHCVSVEPSSHGGLGE